MASPPVRHSAASRVTAAIAASSHDDVQLIAEPYVGQIVLHVRPTEAAPTIRAFGIDALPTANRFQATPAGDLAWLSPTQYLLITRDARVGPTLAALTGALPRADVTLVDMSASAIGLRLSGNRAREVLASCCSLDFHPRAFAPGRCARTLLAKAPVFVRQTDDTPTYQLLVRNSYVDYVVDWLTDGIGGLS